MPTFQIIPARPWHCGQMCRLLRSAHREAVTAIGVDAHRELRDRFEASAFRRAWLVDGKLGALGGVMGSPLATAGFIWLALAEDARKYPLAIVKEARRQLDLIMVTKRELATTVLQDDEPAMRLAVFLGFHVDHSPEGGPAVSRQGRRRLVNYIDRYPDCRLQAANGGTVIAMGYHHEEAA